MPDAGEKRTTRSRKSATKKDPPANSMYQNAVAAMCELDAIWGKITSSKRLKARTATSCEKQNVDVEDQNDAIGEFTLAELEDMRERVFSKLLEDIQASIKSANRQLQEAEMDVDESADDSDEDCEKHSKLDVMLNDLRNSASIRRLLTDIQSFQPEDNQRCVDAATALDDFLTWNAPGTLYLTRTNFLSYDAGCHYSWQHSIQQGSVRKSVVRTSRHSYPSNKIRYKLVSRCAGVYMCQNCHYTKQGTLALNVDKQCDQCDKSGMTFESCEAVQTLVWTGQWFIKITLENGHEHHPPVLHRSSSLEAPIQALLKRQGENSSLPVWKWVELKLGEEELLQSCLVDAMMYILLMGWTHLHRSIRGSPKNSDGEKEEGESQSVHRPDLQGVVQSMNDMMTYYANTQATENDQVDLSVKVRTTFAKAIVEREGSYGMARSFDHLASTLISNEGHEQNPSTYRITTVLMRKSDKEITMVEKAVEKVVQQTKKTCVSGPLLLVHVVDAKTDTTISDSFDSENEKDKSETEIFDIVDNEKDNVSDSSSSKRPEVAEKCITVGRSLKGKYIQRSLKVNDVPYTLIGILQHENNHFTCVCVNQDNLGGVPVGNATYLSQGFCCVDTLGGSKSVDMKPFDKFDSFDFQNIIRLVYVRD